MPWSTWVSTDEAHRRASARRGYNKRRQAAAPLPVICPTCGLPSRLDVDPSTLTDDPAVQARLERAMARLIGAAQDPQAPCLARPRRNDRPGVKGQTLGAPARAV
jgi:hypothetical protein